MDADDIKATARRDIPIKGLIQTLGLTLAVAASLATLGSVWLQIRKTNPQLDLVIESMQNLTNLPKIPQLKADFSFDDRAVSDLWQLRIRLVNSGPKTIIGEGPQKNIVKDSIVVNVHSGFKLLQLQTDSADFPNELKKVDDSRFASTFLQWRPGEGVAATLYLERTDKNIPRPSLLSEERYLIDGDVIVTDACASPPRPKKPLLDRLPSLVAVALRSLSVAVLALLILLCVFVLVKALSEPIRFARWRKKHFAAFSEFVKKEFPDKSDDILARPSKTPATVWEKFDGPKPGATHLLFEGDRQKRSYTIFALVTVMISVAFIAAIAGLLVR